MLCYICNPSNCVHSVICGIVCWYYFITDVFCSSFAVFIVMVIIGLLIIAVATLGKIESIFLQDDCMCTYNVLLLREGGAQY